MKINKTKAIVLHQYNDNLIRALLSLKIEETEFPELKPDEVLVKLFAAPCNPSDIAFLRGGYNIIKPVPAVPGFEASGTVIDTGDAAEELMGKKVSCFSQADADGTWAEYFRVKVKDCIILKEGMDMQQAACLAINPMTAVGMFRMVLQRQAKAFILDAAGGQVPGFMRVLAREKGIGVINIVRKERQVEDLKKEGEAFVIDSHADDFEKKLKEACAELKPALAFDAVAGELSGQMLNAMPAGSELVVYGGLSGNPVSGIDSMGPIFKKKSVSGFNLGAWISEIGREEFLKLADSVQQRFIDGRFHTNIQATYELADAVSGVRAYLKSMSDGKVLLVPGN